MARNLYKHGFYNGEAEGILGRLRKLDADQNERGRDGGRLRTRLGPATPEPSDSEGEG